MNTVFTEDTVLKKIDEMKRLFAPEIKRHIELWGSYGTTLRTVADWQNNINVLKIFAANRKSYVCRHICDKFGVEGWNELILNIAPSNCGKIKINSITPEHYPWQGDYFSGVPVTLLAIPNTGYCFSHWLGISSADSLSNTLAINLSQALSVSAIFKKDSAMEATNIVDNMPLQFTLEQNYPNPFNPDTYICYRLPETAAVSLEIFDLTGQRIRAIVHWSNQSGGSYTAHWNGRDDFGVQVASGIYIYHFDARGLNRRYIKNRKLVVLK
jgi:hypothetical protein